MNKEQAYRQTPGYKARQKAHQQTPEYKVSSRAYRQVHRQTPEFKAYEKTFRKAYRQTPQYKARTNEYFRNRYATDIQYKLKINLRSRLRKALDGIDKKGSAVRDLGCTIVELKAYLESLFKPGMTWENHTHDGWHIDHIKPLVSFDLTDSVQLKQACHFTNLQPLWAKENMSKRDKFDRRDYVEE